MPSDLTIRIKAEVSGFVNGIRKAQSGLAGLDRQTGKTSSSFGRLLKTAAASTAALGVGKLIKDSVQLEAAYSKTMAQVAVATNAPKASLEELDALAMKLGADTVFSAQDAGNAMLELAKGGLTTAQIQGGALADTLTLASAGGLELGDAANVVVQAMGAFQLGADQTSGAIAALAGAANSSSANVSDITQALQQAGTSANAAGLSIQETTAYLALFADSGIKGSDAGTSLRTMLTRLVPQTKSAASAMDALNLSYVDGNGKLVDATEIASRTQDAFKGLSDEEKIRYGNAIFGADAQRAVNILTAKGDEGLKKYLKSTSDVTQAQKLAKAANSGTAGALEQFSGAVETAKIQIGKGLAPVMQDLADKGADLAESGDFERWAHDGAAAVVDFATEVQPLASSLLDLGESALPAVKGAAEAAATALTVAADVVKPFVDAFNKLPASAQQALVLAAGAKTLSSRMGGLPGLATSAGTSLGGFGDKAKGADKKVGGLATSLKGYGTLAAGFAALDLGSDLFDSASRSLGAGKGPADTIGKIEKQLKASNVGKYAKDLNIDIGKLAAEMARTGSQGDYYNETVGKLEGTFEGTGGAAKSMFDTFINLGVGSTEKAKLALQDLDSVVGDAGLKVDKARNGYALLVNGLGAYVDSLQNLPTKAVTEITTPGAVTSAEDVLSLQKRFALTPDEVRTIMKALDLAKPVIRDVNTALKGLDGDVATVTIRTIRETITKSYTEDQGGNSPGVDAAFGGKKKAAGGAIFGPGTGTSDSIPARLSNGEHVWTAREVAAAGGQRAMYAMRRAVRDRQGFAAGGAVGTSGPATGSIGGSVSLVGAQVAIDPRTNIATFVRGEIQMGLASQSRYNSSTDKQDGRR